MIEFLAAGGVAMTLLELGDVDGAERWLELAAATAAFGPVRETPPSRWRRGVASRARVRATLRACAAISRRPWRWRPRGGHASARCEALAHLAVEAARLARRGATKGTHDPALAELVERSAAQVKEVLAAYPATPHGARAPTPRWRRLRRRAAIPPGAVAAGTAAFQALQTGHHEDVSLDIVVPAARVSRRSAARNPGTNPGSPSGTTLSRIAQGTADELIRVRWLTGPIGRDLVELAGPLTRRHRSRKRAAHLRRSRPATGPTFDERRRRLLQLLTEGRTNTEIATELDLAEDDVAQRLARLFARLGTSSRAETTSLAFRGLAAVGSL